MPVCCGPSSSSLPHRGPKRNRRRKTRNARRHHIQSTDPSSITHRAADPPQRRVDFPTHHPRTRRFATGKVDEAREAVETKVAQVRERAHDTWDRLEKVFEDRVARALTKLGVPARDELQALLDRVEELNRSIRKGSARAEVAKAGPARRAPRKSGRKSARKA